MLIADNMSLLLLASAAGFLAALFISSLYYHIKFKKILEQTSWNLQLQNETKNKLLELDIQNLENELDIIRDQLIVKESALLKKADELSKMNELRAIYATRAAQINDYKEALNKASENVQQLRDESYQYQIQLSELEIKSREQFKAAQLIIEQLEQAKQQQKEQFELLGNKIFSDNTQQLKKSNQQEITHLLNPFREQFTDFKRKIEQLHELETRDRVSLAAQVKQLSQLNQQISEDTINLTRALKGDVKFQGNWGETVLQHLLESSGLRKDLEYFLQPTFHGDQQQVLRPDAIINLPDNKTVIIDAKVSLKSYSLYAGAIDDAEQKKALKGHIQSIKNHIKLLSAKDYSAIETVHSLDFVLLFVPIEQALMLAINEQPEMIFSAFEQRIILVSATTLLATVRTIENFWRYDKQQSNAEEIARRAGDMLDKFSLFVTELEAIGGQLDKAKNSYNIAHNRLFSGNGNLISKARFIQELGIKGKKTL